MSLSPAGASGGRSRNTSAAARTSVRPFCLDQLVGDRVQVVAAVAVARECETLAEALEVAQPHTDREDLHLPAGVVDVVLAVHGIAGRIEQVGERGTERGVPAVAHVQRSRGVRRDELDDHALPGALLAPAIGRAEVEHAQQFQVPRGRREMEIDEARASDFDFRDELTRRQRVHDRLGDVARLALRNPGKLHCRIGGEIAVGRVAGAFDRRYESGCFRAGEFIWQRRKRIAHQVFYQVFQGVAVRKESGEGGQSREFEVRKRVWKMQWLRCICVLRCRSRGGRSEEFQRVHVQRPADLARLGQFLDGRQPAREESLQR